MAEMQFLFEGETLALGDGAAGAGTLGNIHEPGFNPALGRALRRKRAAWRDPNAVIYERSDVLEDARAKTPDVLVVTPGAAPISIEVEWGAPAVADARGRLGKAVKGGGQIRSAIAVGAPRGVIHWTDERLERDLESLEFAFVVLSSTRAPNGQRQGDLLPKSDEVARWPLEGHVTGTLDDLACLCEYATAPAQLVARMTDSVASRIQSLAEMMRRSGLTGTTLDDIGRLLGQHSHAQALRLACCIWLTAFRLQTLLAQNSASVQAAGLRPVSSYFRPSMAVGEPPLLSPMEIQQAWGSILSVNYRAVFETAEASLDARIPVRETALAISEIARMAEEVESSGFGNRIDFAGELFPKLLDDREEVAAHYTLPATAELLAALAADRVASPDWSDADAVAALRIADMACGTGSLLRAAYQNVRRRHEALGGDGAGVHRAMLSGGATGLDVNALAAHMTAAGLSSYDLAQEYETANIGVAPIEDGKTGSLELLAGEELARGLAVPDGSQDLVIQNPPYLRARGGRKMFAVSGIAEEERKRSVKRLEMLRRAYGGEWTHGQAGHGPEFSALAHRKLKPGGVFASVLPLTAAHAESWTGFRKSIEAHYDDVTAIAFTVNAVASKSAMMSADTHMNEMLLVATKRAEPRPAGEGAAVTCVNLSRPLRSLVEAYWLSKLIAGIEREGDSGELWAAGRFGSWVRFSPADAGGPWQALGIRSPGLAVAGLSLRSGRLRAPGRRRGWDFALPLAILGDVVGIGPTHDLIGHPVFGDGRGVFRFYPITAYDHDAPTFPALWGASKAHHVGPPSKMTARATHRGSPMPGKTEEEVGAMLDARSDIFISRNLRTTTQPLAAAKTSEPMMGGSSWTALLSDDEGVKAALAVWLNSTLGAIMRTAYAQTTQPGRARMQVRAIKDFPVPDFAAESEAGAHARAAALERLPALAELELRPFAYAAQDDNRKAIDAAALGLVGLGANDDAASALDWLRQEWCKEPATHGGNETIMSATGVVPD